MSRSTMNDKTSMIALLREEFENWEKLLADLSAEQIRLRPAPGEMSIKEVITHLWAWQQLSIARLEAAQEDREPEFQLWPSELDPDNIEEDNVDPINAWVRETYADKSWAQAYQDWHEGFVQCLDLAEAVPDQDLLDAERFPWLEGYALFAVLEGAYEHHFEHREDHVVA